MTEHILCIEDDADMRSTIVLVLEDQVQRIQTSMQFERERHEQQGVKLGLMIAKRLTEVHQGTFHVISAGGKGTTVTLSFPLLPDSSNK